MNSVLGSRQLINLFHIFFVGPLLWALATNRLSEEYKQYVVWLALILVIYHAWLLVSHISYEGMENVNGTNVHHIRMFDSSPGYDKPIIDINKGDVIVWSNIGEVEHTVTSDNDFFNSGYLKPGENYAIKFDNPGTFTYSCLHHNGWMKGVVNVN